MIVPPKKVQIPDEWKVKRKWARQPCPLKPDQKLDYCISRELGPCPTMELCYEWQQSLIKRGITDKPED